MCYPRAVVAVVISTAKAKAGAAIEGLGVCISATILAAKHN